jgi:hypothetical protein
MKEGIGGDNLSIAWRYPNKPREVIPARFSQVTNPAAVTKDPMIGTTLDVWQCHWCKTESELINEMANKPYPSFRLLHLLEGPENSKFNEYVDNKYISRMRGWLVPPVNGDFLFWIASNGYGEFWLSSTDNPADKVLICRQPRDKLAGPRQWDVSAEQKSGPISLVAGRAYYYEVRDFLQMQR